MTTKPTPHAARLARALALLLATDLDPGQLAGLITQAAAQAGLSRYDLQPRPGRAERRQAVARALRAEPNRSDAWLADLTGTTGKTVRRMRRQLEATSEIPRLDRLTGRDGVSRPRSINRADGSD